MKITIDTKEDSHDEIKKVIKLLQTMVESSHNPDIFSSGSSLLDSPSAPAEPTPSMFGMFGEGSKVDIPSTDEPLTKSELADESEETEVIEDTSPEVQLY